MWLHGLIPTSGPDPKRVREDPVMTVEDDDTIVELDVPDHVTELRCYDCAALKSVTNGAKLNSISVYNCEALESITGCPLLQIAGIRSCKELRAIESGELKVLELNHTPKVVSIKNIRSLTRLECHGCDNLVSISNLETLHSLNIVMCDRLSTVTNLPELQSLTGKSSSVHVTKCPKLSKVEGEFNKNVTIEGWRQAMPPQREWSKRNRPKTRSSHDPSDPNADLKALIIKNENMKIELCTNMDDLNTIIQQIHTEHGPSYYFSQKDIYFEIICASQSKGIERKCKLYIARIEGAPFDLQERFGERCVLPALICTDVDDGNVFVTHLWISKDIQGANIAQRMINALKPKYYNAPLDDAAFMFWESVNFLTAREYAEQHGHKWKWEKV